MNILWDVMPHILVEIYQMFGGSVSSEMSAFFFEAAGLLGCDTLSGPTHTAVWCHIPQDLHSQWHYCENVSSHN